MVPRNFFLTCGSGVDNDPLISFGLALLDAGIAQFNLVKVSSIIPPTCKLIPKEEGIKLLSPGEIVYCVLAKRSTCVSELITAAIGAAIPSSPTEVGCFYELTAIGKSKVVVGEEAGKLAHGLLTKTLGLKPSRILNIAIEAMGKESVCTTVIAVAVLT